MSQMKELFSHNNVKGAYKYFRVFLQKRFTIVSFTGKTHKDSFELLFRGNDIESELTVDYFNQDSYNKLQLAFTPDLKDFIFYRLDGWEINLENISDLMKLRNYSYIPKCPKCGSFLAKYYEKQMDNTTYLADLTGNPFIKYREDSCSFSHPLKLEAKCSCGHRWKIRNAISASRIREANSHDIAPYSIERHSVERLRQKDIDTPLIQPAEYARTGNEKPIKNPSHVLTKKEIGQLLKAIDVGDKDE
jgi:hypothetical protein